MPTGLKANTMNKEVDQETKVRQVIADAEMAGKQIEKVVLPRGLTLSKLDMFRGLVYGYEYEYGNSLYVITK